MTNVQIPHKMRFQAQISAFTYFYLYAMTEAKLS